MQRNCFDSLHFIINKQININTQLQNVLVFISLDWTIKSEFYFKMIHKWNSTLFHQLWYMLYSLGMGVVRLMYIKSKNIFFLLFVRKRSKKQGLVSISKWNVAQDWESWISTDLAAGKIFCTYVCLYVCMDVCEHPLGCHLGGDCYLVWY